MKKRKALARKTAKKKPALTAKPLRELWERLSTPEERTNFTLAVSGGYSPIPGVPLPADHENALGFFSREETKSLVIGLENPPAIPVDPLLEEYEHAYDPVELQGAHVAEIQYSIKRALRTGFNLALLRYADELKNVPEAVALLEAKRQASQKGAAARRKQAAPNHKAIRRRFKELAKTIPKATARYLRIGKEFGMHEDSVARIIRGESG
jgi:hypothetical protein